MHKVELALGSIKQNH